jgi:hypothetical protein
VTLAELLVASAISVTVVAAVLGVAIPAQRTFAVEQEAADMQQRLRVAGDALARDLRNARLVWPYRVGAIGHDPASGIFFRPDTISLLLRPDSNEGARPVTRTYYLRIAPERQLARYDGGAGDFAMVPDVIALAFEYFADGVLAPIALTDGPWYPDDTSPDRFDVDLRRIRRVRVRMRLQASAPFRGPAGLLFAHGGTATAASRTVPDLDVRFDVAVRNSDAAP